MRASQEHGFSLLEMLISLAVLAVIMGAAVELVRIAVNQHDSEQNAVDTNQGALTGLQLMTMEIAQAGSHGDHETTTSAGITATVEPQTVSVSSSAGFTTGDYISVGIGSNSELVKITDTASNSITGIFRTAHDSGIPVRLFALPYLKGVIPPAGLGANSSATVTALKFFGDMNSDGKIYYMEYAYDAANAQITRSMTPIPHANKNAALPIVTHIKSNSVTFRLYTDELGVVTSVDLAFVVQSPWKTGTKYQESALATRIAIPSAVAASALLKEIKTYGGVNQLPATPAQVTTWAGQ